MMQDKDREAQHRRITEPKRSKSAKLGWKRHHNNYMMANRKKERDCMNKSFYSISKELEEAMDGLNEANIDRDSVFDLNCDISLNNIAGGLSFKINKDNGEVSIATSMIEGGHGNYRLEVMPQEEALKGIYDELKDDLEQLARTIDQSINQIVAKHGLRQA